MLILTKRFIAVSVILTCATKIYATPNKSYFRKRFVTPNKCPDHPDDCEILERSGFHPEENNSDCKNSAPIKSRSQEDDPKKVVARAEVNVHIPRERHGRPRKEIFIRSDSSESGSSEKYSRQIMKKPPYHYPEYEPPYMFPYAPPYRYPYYYNPHFMYPSPDLLHSCYPRPRSCESQDVEGSRKNFDFNQNIFQIVKFKKRKCENSKAERHSRKSLDDVPHVYLYKKNKDGTDPAPDEIRNQPASPLTDEDLKLVDKFIEKNAKSSESSEESEEYFCPVRPRPRPCTRRYPCKKYTTCRTTPRCTFKPTTKRCSCPTRKCTPRYTQECTRSTRCTKPTIKYSTTPSSQLSTEEVTGSDCTTDQSLNTNTFKSTTCDSNASETSSDGERSTISGATIMQSTTCSQFSNATESPTATTHKYCTTERPRCKYDKNVILTKVMHSCTPCTDRPRDNSSCYVSDMIRFIKIKLCDLAKSCCNCSSCECSSEEEECKKCNKNCNRRCGRTSLKDIDELYYSGNCEDAIANCPYNPYVNSVCPWGYPRYGPYFPFGNPGQYAGCYNRNSREIPPGFDERYFYGPGYLEPLNWFPPWFYPGLDGGNQSSCKRTRRCSRY